MAAVPALPAVDNTNGERTSPSDYHPKDPSTDDERLSGPSADQLEPEPFHTEDASMQGQDMGQIDGSQNDILVDTLGNTDTSGVGIKEDG